MYYNSLLVFVLSVSLLAEPIIDPNSTPIGVESIDTSGGNMTVDVNSDKAYIEWNTFNIVDGEIFNVTGQSKDSILLNKVTGILSSTIDGIINAEGSVWLINTNGITVGATATINVFGFVASTLDITKTDFLDDDNQYNFAGSTGAVTFGGNVNTTELEGYVMLAGTSVTHTGTITAKFGKVVLYSGPAVTVDFNGDGLISFTASNLTNDINIAGGKIDVSGDIADLTNYINMSGDQSALSITQAGDVLVFGGDVGISGGSEIKATSNDLDGGSITINATDFLGFNVYDQSTLGYQNIWLDVGSVSKDSGSITLDGNAIDVYGAGWASPQRFVYFNANAPAGNAGEIIINAEGFINLSGAKLEASSVDGNGGNIELNTVVGNIFVDSYSEIIGNSAQGNAGQLIINSGGNIDFYGDLFFNSNIGNAGQLVINSDDADFYGGDYYFNSVSGNAGSAVINAPNISFHARFHGYSLGGNGGDFSTIANFYLSVGGEDGASGYSHIDLSSEAGFAGSMTLEGGEFLNYEHSELTKARKLELISDNGVWLIPKTNFGLVPLDMPVILFNTPDIIPLSYNQNKYLEIKVGDEPMLIMGNPNKNTTIYDAGVNFTGNQNTPVKVIYINPSDLFLDLGFNIVEHIDTNNAISDKGRLAIYHNFERLIFDSPEQFIKFNNEFYWPTPLGDPNDLKDNMKLDNLIYNEIKASN